jgi:hypothetical protein
MANSGGAPTATGLGYALAALCRHYVPVRFGDGRRFVQECAILNTRVTRSRTYISMALAPK